jgi:LuxR family glucitol operon transcriptional activator
MSSSIYIMKTKTKVQAMISAIEHDSRDCLTHYGLSLEDVPLDIKEKIQNKKGVNFLQDEGLTIRTILDETEFTDLAKFFRTIKPKLSESNKFCAEFMAEKILFLKDVRNRAFHTKPLQENDLENTQEFSQKLIKNYKLFYDFTTVKLALAGEYVSTSDVELEESRIKHNLPLAEYDETTFIGREQELKNLKHKLTKVSAPVISIIGTGGVGKTAFATHCLYALVEEDTPEFDYIVWTSFKQNKLTDEGIESIKYNFSNLLESIASIPFETIDKTKPLESILSWMSDFKVLLVLDNLETLSAEDSNLMQLLEDLPRNSKILITSRVGLGQIEHRIPLEPLAKKEAVELFRKYANYLSIKNNKVLLEQNSIETRCEALFFNPLLIRWFLTSVASGKEASLFSRRSDSFEQALNFCLHTVFDSLSELQKQIVYVLYCRESPITRIEINYYLEEQFSVDSIFEAFNKLCSLGLFSPSTNQEQKTTTYVLSLIVKHYISILKEEKEDLDALFKWILEKDKSLRRDEQTSSVRVNNYLYKIDRIAVQGNKGHNSIIRTQLIKIFNLYKCNQEEALIKLENFTKRYPNISEAHRISGFLHSSSGNLLKAKEEYDIALELDPKNTLILYTVAKFYDMKMAKFDVALDFITKALELDPEALTLRSMEALYKSREGKPEASSLYLGLLETIQKDSVPDYYKIQIFDQAIDCFRRSAENAADIPNRQRFNSDLTQAMLLVTKAVALNFTDEKLFRRLSQIVGEMGRSTALLDTQTYRQLTDLIDKNSLLSYLTFDAKQILENFHTLFKDKSM